MTKRETIERQRERAQNHAPRGVHDRTQSRKINLCARQNGGRPDISVCITAEMRGYPPCQKCEHRPREVSCVYG